MNKRLSVIALLLLAACSNESDINNRKAYWEKEIANHLKSGITKTELEKFAESRGQRLNCYQNQYREDQCSFDDNRSIGGFKTYPLRLSVIFKFKNDVFTTHLFSTTPLKQEQTVRNR